MPNAAAHRVVAGLAVWGVSAYAESKKGESTYKPLIHGVLASTFGTLPDVLEPSIGNPNLDKPQDKYLHEIIFCKMHRKSFLRY